MSIAWDASRNVTFAPLTRATVSPSAVGGDLQSPFTFTANGAPFGSYDNPEILMAGATVEQTISLKEGWNWVSFYVNTKGQSLNDTLKFANGKITTVKTQTHGAEWNPELDRTGRPFGFMGRDLESLNENSMYAMKAVEPVSVTVSGKLLTADEATQTIAKGWTWIRNPYYKNRSVTSAFSGFSAEDADVLQARDSYAQWSQAYSRWEGLMTNFMPGLGYKYYSGDSMSKSLFEDLTSQNALARPSVSPATVPGASPSGTAAVPGASVSGTAPGIEQSSGHNYGYADNMLVIAKLMLANGVADQDTIAVTATNDSQEPFTTLPDREYYVLTVAGADNSPFTFEATVDGQRIKLYPYVAGEEGDLQPLTVIFEPDAVVGTFASPVILSDVKDIQAISDLSLAPDTDYEVYSLQGVLLYKGKNSADALTFLKDCNARRRCPLRGIYIVNGRKVIVRDKR